MLTKSSSDEEKLSKDPVHQMIYNYNKATEMYTYAHLVNLDVRALSNSVARQALYAQL